jgi:hypothetical protein
VFAFVFTMLVILSIALGVGAIIALPVLFIKKKYGILALIFGLVALLAAFPAGFWTAVVSDGCCGSSDGQGGIGWLVGIVLGVAGILLLLKSKSLHNK